MSKHSNPQTGMLESILLQLPLRIFLGGVFVFAAYNKIPAIQSFAEAIKGFQLLDADTHPELIVVGAFVIPWFELLAGLMLIIGLRARSAAMGIGLLLALFIYALLHVIFTDVSADCSCFGDENFICGSTVGWCQVIRNIVFLIPAGYLMIRGPGRVSLDQALGKPEQITYNPQNASQSVDA
ncbi:MAG: DoxX family protein [Phycisphaerales bacterium]